MNIGVVILRYFMPGLSGKRKRRHDRIHRSVAPQLASTFILAASRLADMTSATGPVCRTSQAPNRAATT